MSREVDAQLLGKYSDTAKLSTLSVITYDSSVTYYNINMQCSHFLFSCFVT